MGATARRRAIRLHLHLHCSPFRGGAFQVPGPEWGLLSPVQGHQVPSRLEYLHFHLRGCANVELRLCFLFAHRTIDSHRKKTTLPGRPLGDSQSHSMDGFPASGLSVGEYHFGFNSSAHIETCSKRVLQNSFARPAKNILSSPPLLDRSCWPRHGHSTPARRIPEHRQIVGGLSRVLQAS